LEVEYVRLYGSPESLTADGEDDSSDDDEMSSVESFSDHEAADMEL
jgi:hypothetical protein